MNARTPTEAAVQRCAIYTRKSSEEGLEQSFNSLQAQREACEAYIKSQSHQGWVCLPDAYDDGGYSGGSMDRPALRRLLADIEAGRVDTIAIYKIDRLTRSLADFAKIVEVLDRAGASFVSITQSFNTTTSMGRLTLNVLLSFAQFEREVTGERIRDKIAASKAKGMWMGGNLPLGYDAGDHTLVVNEAEADLVRAIFARYLKVGSVHRLCDQLGREGITSKAWVSTRGRAMGGRTFTRGALYHLLQNRHYLGEIVHKGASHPGAHPPIVEEKVFHAVQAKLARNRRRRRERPTLAAKAALTGKIFNADGRPYSPTFAIGRLGRRYGYYVLTDLQLGLARPNRGAAPARLPAAALEVAILEHLRRLTGRPEASWDDFEPILGRLEVRPHETRLTLDAEGLFGADHPDLAFEDLQGRLTTGERAVRAKDTVVVAIPGKLSFRGGAAWASQAPSADPRPDPALLRALRTAHQLLKTHGLEPDQIDPLARAPAQTTMGRLACLALLAPDIQRAIVEGRDRPHWTVARLIEAATLLAWPDQRAAL